MNKNHKIIGNQLKKEIMR